MILICFKDLITRIGVFWGIKYDYSISINNIPQTPILFIRAPIIPKPSTTLRSPMVPFKRSLMVFNSRGFRVQPGA